MKNIRINSLAILFSMLMLSTETIANNLLIDEEPSQCFDPYGNLAALLGIDSLCENELNENQNNQHLPPPYLSSYSDEIFDPYGNLAALLGVSLYSNESANYYGWGEVSEVSVIPDSDEVFKERERVLDNVLSSFNFLLKQVQTNQIDFQDLIYNLQSVDGIVGVGFEDEVVTIYDHYSSLLTIPLILRGKDGLYDIRHLPNNFDNTSNRSADKKIKQYSATTSDHQKLTLHRDHHTKKKKALLVSGFLGGLEKYSTEGMCQLKRSFEKNNYDVTAVVDIDINKTYTDETGKSFNCKINATSDRIVIAKITSQMDDYSFVYYNTHAAPGSMATGIQVKGPVIGTDVLRIFAHQQKKESKWFGSKGADYIKGKQYVVLGTDYFDDLPNNYFKKNNTIFHIDGCNSGAKKSGSSLLDSIRKKGATAAIGYDNYMNDKVTKKFTTPLYQCFAKGQSLQACIKKLPDEFSVLKGKTNVASFIGTLIVGDSNHYDTKVVPETQDDLIFITDHADQTQDTVTPDQGVSTQPHYTIENKRIEMSSDINVSDFPYGNRSRIDLSWGIEGLISTFELNGLDPDSIVDFNQAVFEVLLTTGPEQLTETFKGITGHSFSQAVSKQYSWTISLWANLDVIVAVDGVDAYGWRN